RLDDGDALADALRRVEALEPRRDHLGDVRGAELAGRGLDPDAVLVELADDPRPHVLAPVVELLLQLVLDDGALLLDDEDLLEPLGEAADAVALQGPGHADLVETDPDLRGVRLVDAEVLQGLTHVEIGLARRDDDDPLLGAVLPYVF